MCKRICLLLLSVSLCAIYLLAPVVAAEGAPVAVMNEMTYEFPPQFDGTDVVHDFVIKNKGDADLTITDVKAG
jgi:hypothetical protein